MPKTLNVAVIGAGTMAQAVHLPVLRRRWDRFTVAALVDHSPRRRREASDVWGIGEDKRYESVGDLIAAVRSKTLSLDAAVLATDGLHVEDLLQLMRRGIPVLVEPPLGFSAEEVAKVADFERMTGRRLVMMAYPQQYDESVARMSEQIATKDLRMVDHEVLMPASQPLFGGAHVTSSSYDLPSDVRSQRRSDLQAAVVAGSGEGATQRDRDLYVKGLLTGVAHQMAVMEAVYGPITRVTAVRHWPKGVIPGSLEILGELEGGAHVRLVWHYLPFAPEYSEHIKVLSARRRMEVELPAPSHGDRRSGVSLREKKGGAVQETATVATKGSVEAMWEAFHSFVEKGVRPVSGAEEARNQVTLLREVLSTIVVADGRSLDLAPDAADEEQGSDSEAESADPSASGPLDSEPAAETLEQEPATAADVAGAPDGEPPALEPESQPAPETLEQEPATPSPHSSPADQRPTEQRQPVVPAAASDPSGLPEPTNPTEPIDYPDAEPGAAPRTGRDVLDVWNLRSDGLDESTWPPEPHRTSDAQREGDDSAGGSAAPAASPEGTGDDEAASPQGSETTGTDPSAESTAGEYRNRPS
ncbi:Gfo/Idh/MocA family oxidoreductase [Brachybacterium sp. GCM10030267]|uniref:Gfo/Idh/MocA family oxidoreductase n=1 Tax=Brachybacterium sp. GCM10030267 TaxID=3273381 RepID=UPI0036208620